MSSLRMKIRCGEWRIVRADEARRLLRVFWGRTRAQGEIFRRTLCPGLAVALVLMFLFLAWPQAASAIPAFARKNGLRCAACHEAWPKLTSFGQNFKDNGYQIGNERDSPVYQSPLYWAMSARITPQWHTELNTAEATKQAKSGVQSVSTQGFDISGMDLWTAGTISKNITFVVLPSSDEYGNFHFEAAWLRFDNLLKSSWLNAKAGKFELDTLVSEKRILTLSQVGGVYQFYHYLPLVDPKAFSVTPVAAGELGASATNFGLGDNQLGAEVMGHSRDDYSRVSAAVLTSSDGAVNLPTSKSYDAFFTGSRAFDIGPLGLQRVGAFSYLGQAPTRYLTETPAGGGTPTDIAGSGFGNKGFTRTGVFAMLSVKKVDIVPMYTHATESAYVALGIPSNEVLPVGVSSPTWNGRMVELFYTQNLHLTVIARYEDIRNSTQIFQKSVSNFGDQDTETIAFRWYPFTHSRAGLAIEPEYSKSHQTAVSAIGTNQTLRSAFIGLDFAF